MQTRTHAVPNSSLHSITISRGAVDVTLFGDMQAVNYLAHILNLPAPTTAPVPPKPMPIVPPAPIPTPKQANPLLYSFRPIGQLFCSSAAELDLNQRGSDVPRIAVHATPAGYSIHIYLDDDSDSALTVNLVRSPVHPVGIDSIEVFDDTCENPALISKISLESPCLHPVHVPSSP